MNHEVSDKAMIQQTDREQICLRRLISHVELDALSFPVASLVVSYIDEMRYQMEPITDYRTRASLVHISGEPYTLLEVRA